MNPCRPFYRCVATALSGILFWNPLLSAAAELAVDRNAGGNTAIGQAGNGAPVVNIGTPSAKGLSHNKFTHYNVGKDGLILNNSQGPANSSIAGGKIGGNPNLGGGSARVILNEVTSTNKSHLGGYTEVAGPGAHVVVANPHGVTCDGCGFINTPRATLTTGKPVVEGGELKRYEVDQGQVTFEGQDANLTNVNQFEIITRSMQLNAKLHAKDASVVLGTNDVDAQTLEAAPREGTGEKPKLALDAGALGGMYVNSIRLVGTEAGVGVNFAGGLAASGGDIKIDVNGKLMLASVAAAQELAAKAHEIEVKEAQAGQKATLEAKTVRVTGALAAPQAVILAEGLINTGSILASSSLTLRTSWLQNRGSLVSQNVLGIHSATLDNAGGEILARSLGLRLDGGSWVNEGTLAAGNDLTLNLAGLENRGVLGAGNVLVLEMPDFTNHADALLFAGADMAFYGQNFTNYGDVQVGGNFYAASDHEGGMAESVRNRSGTVQVGGSVGIFSKLFENVRDVLEIATTKKAVLSEPDCVKNCGKENQVFQHVLEETQRTEVVEASAPAWLLVGGDMAFIGGDFKNDASVLAIGGNLHIQADNYENTGYELGDKTLWRHMQGATIKNIKGSEYEKQLNYTNAFNAHYNEFGPLEAVNAEIKWFMDEIIYGTGMQTHEYLGATFSVKAGGRGLRVYNNHGTTKILSTTNGSTPAENAGYYQGVVQAGGNIVIEAKNKIGQGIERADFEYIGAGEAANGLSLPVSFNPQLAPDLAHKLTDPLAVTGLPTGALFQQAAPGHPWLLQVSPYVSQQATLSSDYLLSLLGVLPDAAQKRLGDAALEQWLIRQAILARLGAWLLDGFESEEAQYRALMENAAKEAKAQQLSLGTALNAQQIAALKHDIVWFVEKEIQGQKVLSPVLYLAQNANRIGPNGAAMTAQNIQLSAQNLANSGVIKAENLLALIDGKLENSGLMQGKENLALLAETITNTRGGILAGEDVFIQAQGNFINEASVTTYEANLTPGENVLVRVQRSAKSVSDEAQLRPGGDASSKPDGADGVTYEFLHRTREDLIDAPARVEAGNNLVIQAGGNLINRGSVIQAGGDAYLGAGGSIIIDSAETRQELKGKGGDWEVNNWAATQHAGEVSAGGSLTLEAGQDLAVVGSHVRANGDAVLLAGGQIVLAAAANEGHILTYRESGNQTRHRIVDRVDQQSATVSGDNVTLVSGGDITLVSSQIQAKNNATLAAQGEINLLAAFNEAYDFQHKKDKGTASKKVSTDIAYEAQSVTNRIEAGGSITIQSEGNQTYQRAQLFAGEELSIRSNGDIRFEAVTDRSERVRSKSDNNGLWQSNSNKGKIDETVRQTEMRSPNQPLVEALGGITVQVKEMPPERQYVLGKALGRVASSPLAGKPIDTENLGADGITRAIEAMAAESPDLAWVKQLNDRGGIDYEQVKEVHKEWSKRQEGLGTVGAIIVAVVIAALTYGAASALVGTAASAGAGSGTAMAAAGTATAVTATGATVTTTVAAGWANAAIASAAAGAASSAAVQLGTGGRVDWNQVGKSALVAGITAGLLNYQFDALGGQSVNQWAGFAPKGTEAAAGAANPVPQAVGGFNGSVTQLAAVTGKGVVSAGVANAIQGTDFKDGLLNSVVGDLAALSANHIGSNWDPKGKNPNPVLHMTAHAALGATAAQLTGRDAAAGALGGLAEAVLTNTLQQSDWKIENGTAYTAFSMFAGGMLAEAFGRDGVTGAGAAQNAAQNNYLKHAEAAEYQELLERKRAGRCDASCLGRMGELDRLDAFRNAQLRGCNGNGSAMCVEIRQELFDAAAEYVRLQPNDPKWASAFYTGPKDGAVPDHNDRLAFERMETFDLARTYGEGSGFLGGLHGNWTAVKEMGEALWGLVSDVAQGVLGDQEAQDRLKALPGAAWEAVSDPENWPYLVGMMPPEKREQLAQAYERGDGYEVQRLLAEERLNLGSNFIGVGATKNVAKLGTLADAAKAADKLGDVAGAAQKEKILANIAESQAGNKASNFEQFIKNEGWLQESLGIWPPNSGGYSPINGVTLPVGTPIDRYGFPGGNFVSPTGTPFADRALPSAYQTSKPYFQYEVIREIPDVTQAKILPWFGQQGSGTQYQLPNSVQWYLENGYLKPIGK
jgi:filamentous hemagglutinin